VGVCYARSLITANLIKTLFVNYSNLPLSREKCALMPRFPQFSNPNFKEMPVRSAFDYRFLETIEGVLGHGVQ